MDVISEKKNPLMNREEAWIRVDHAGKPTPPRKDIIADVAKHFKAKEDAVIVDKIFSETGKAASKIKVLVYPKADAVPKAKLDKMKIRMKLMKKEDLKAKPDGAKPEGGQPAPADGAKPAEAKPEDKPAEDGKPAEEAKPADDKPAESKPAE